MSWVDIDFLAEGVGKVRDRIRERIQEMERPLGPDDDSPPALIALYALDDGPLSLADDDNRGLAERLAAARALVPALNALADEAFTPVQRLLLAGEIEDAVHREERNNNPDEPYRGY